MTTTLIRDYAKAYKKLNDFQSEQDDYSDDEKLMPTGDQKTGCIGEYYAMQYARSRWSAKKGFNCHFGNHSQYAWDIKVSPSEDSTASILIQVKTVSDFGEGTLSPIHSLSDGHLLWLLALDESLQPKILWEQKFKDIDFGGRKKLSGKKLRDPNNPTTGSQCFNWDDENNLTDQLLKALKS